jgi:hypothetical protein
VRDYSHEMFRCRYPQKSTLGLFFAERAARHLKAELKRADLTYEVLADRLKEHGFGETKASISNKLARATMSAHFFLASLAAIGHEGVRLEEV